MDKMKILKIFIVVIGLLASSNSYSNETTPFNTVQRFFSAMSSFDYKGTKAVVTQDFQLLEVGEVWDINDYFNVLKSLEGKFEKRRNYFSIIRKVSSKDNMWVSYWNKAIIKPIGHDPITLFWLESVVISRENNEWKLQLLHSTKVEHNAIPKEVVFKEYLN